MGLVIGTQHRVTVPHEPGEWVDIRKLSGIEMDQAAQEHVTQTMKRFEGLDLSKIPQPSATEVASRPTEYHAEFVLHAAVTGWSYSDDVDVTQLDASTWSWLLGVVLAENIRPPE